MNATGTVIITAEQIDGGSYDNCGISTLFIDKNEFDCSNLGANPLTNTVTLTVTDKSGNIDFCTALITVIDAAADANVTISSSDASDSVCSGANLTFTPTPSGTFGSEQFYQWFINGIPEGFSDNINTTFTPETRPTEDYSIFARMTTNASNCDFKQSKPLNITVYELPELTTPTGICIGNTYNLSSPSTGS